MKGLTRWWKFNLVGAMGSTLQLSLLAILNRWTRGHYLYATVAAVESTLLHNFAWHQRYTWCGRCCDSSTIARLARFHFSNGLVSMLGNVMVMRFLVHDAHMPALLSNCVAILSCSIINFGVGDTWVFRCRQ